MTGENRNRACRRGSRLQWVFDKLVVARVASCILFEQSRVDRLWRGALTTCVRDRNDRSRICSPRLLALCSDEISYRRRSGASAGRVWVHMNRALLNGSVPRRLWASVKDSIEVAAAAIDHLWSGVGFLREVHVGERVGFMWPSY